MWPKLSLIPLSLAHNKRRQLLLDAPPSSLPLSSILIELVNTASRSGSKHITSVGLLVDVHSLVSIVPQPHSLRGRASKPHIAAIAAGQQLTRFTTPFSTSFMSPAKLHRHSKVRPKQERIDSSMEDVSHDLPIDSTAMPMRAASISVNIGTADASDSGGHGDDAGSSSTTVCSSTNGTRSSAPTSSISASNPTIGGTCYDDAASAMQILGRESRKLIQAIKKLEALSIDSTLPSLPEIIVIGDQSTGIRKLPATWPFVLANAPIRKILHHRSNL